MLAHLNLLIWLDEMLYLAANVEELIELLKLVIKIFSCNEMNKNIRRCQLITSKVHLCGRMIYSNGLCFHHLPQESLIYMETATTVAALMTCIKYKLYSNLYSALFGAVRASS